jgi:hypothetical protein
MRSGKSIDVGLLAESTTTDQLAFVGRSFDGLLKQHQESVKKADEDKELARQAAEMAKSDAERAHAEAENLSGQLARALLSVQQLEIELRSAREEHHASASHAGNDYEVFRARIVRLLNAQLQMLGDALHAVRHDAHEVTDEYLERVMEALRREVSSLKEQR